MRRAVELRHASRLLNHGPTVMVSSACEDRCNVMAAAWSMPVEFTPPRLAVVIDKSTYTRQLVERSGVLALNIACAAQVDITYAVGQTSGADAFAEGTDKFEQMGISTFIGPALGLPLIEGCIGWLECKVLPEGHCQMAYDTFFVEVVAALADPRIFSEGRWTWPQENPELHTLHHLGAGNFAVAGTVIQAKPVMRP